MYVGTIVKLATLNLAPSLVGHTGRIIGTIGNRMLIIRWDNGCQNVQYRENLKISA
jgi:hypothetical protein